MLCTVDNQYLLRTPYSLHSIQLLHPGKLECRLATLPLPSRLASPSANSEMHLETYAGRGGDPNGKN